jgi:hypothetical protein
VVKNSMTSKSSVTHSAIEVARAHGAKIVESLSRPGWWIVLDNPNTLLWDSWFPSERDAAEAYCLHFGLLWVVE